MNAAAAALSHEQLLNSVQYDSVSGRLFRVKNGQEMGILHHSGYVHIKLGGSRFAAHRLVWFYVYGEWPSGCVDHINGKKTDNRIENLRVATASENAANSKSRRNSAGGLKGVTYLPDRRKYRARIRKDYKGIHLGYFDNPDDAAKAYREAANVLFDNFARVT